MIPQYFFDFDPPFPPPPPTRVPLWGGGSKLLCVLRPLCADLHLGPEQFFSGTLTHGGGLGSKHRVTPPPPYGLLLVRTWPLSRCCLGCLVAPKNHLAEVVRSKPGGPVYMGKRHIPPHFGPFWAYSRTLPQGVELLV